MESNFYISRTILAKIYGVSVMITNGETVMKTLRCLSKLVIVLFFFFTYQNSVINILCLSGKRQLHTRIFKHRIK